MNDRLKTALSRKSDQELLEIVLLQADTYRPDTVEAARGELEARGVSLDCSLIEEDDGELNLGRTAWWTVVLARKLWLRGGATVAIWLFLGRVLGPFAFYAVSLIVVAFLVREVGRAIRDAPEPPGPFGLGVGGLNSAAVEVSGRMP